MLNSQYGPKRIKLYSRNQKPPGDRFKLLLLLIALLGLIFVIGMLIFIFFSGGDDTTKQEDKKIKKNIKEPTIVQKTSLKIRKSPEKGGKLPAPEYFRKPLNFKYAVKGNIPGIKSSREASSGLLVDLKSRNVLWAKDIDEPVPIASMTKMMTVLLAMEIINERDDITLDTRVNVTPGAVRIGGSQVYLDQSESFPLRKLLKTVAISSANDSAYLIAEYLCYGDVNLFIQKMNRKAKEMGLRNTKFYNVHGLPGKSADTDNLSTPRDLLVIAENILRYPLVMKWASTKIDYIREETKPFQLFNHNRLIGKCPGVDGIKTGWIRRSGYCVTITCKRGGNRLVGIVTGFKTRKSRDSFMMNLMDWGFRKRLQAVNMAEKERIATEKKSKSNEPGLKN